MPTQRATDTTGLRSVARVLDLLETVVDGRHRSLSELAAASRLTPTTALRHLRALEARGYVQRDDAGAFSVGPTLLRISATVRDTGPLDGLVAAAQPLLDELADTTGESTYLAVSDGATATYVATAESDRAIRHVGWAGQHVPLDGTAVGDALRSPGRCMRRTGAVEPDITAISCALEPIGRLGIAVSVIGPSHRFSDRECAEHEAALRSTVARLARHLGATDSAAAS